MLFLNAKIAIEQNLGHNCQPFFLAMLILCFSTHHPVVIAMYTVIIVARYISCNVVHSGFTQNACKEAARQGERAK